MLVVNLTHSQLESYRSIWGSFTDFDWTFVGRGRTFGFYGRLEVDGAGTVELLDLCVACSGEYANDDFNVEVEQLRRKVASGSTAPGGGTADFRIELSSSHTGRGTTASHLVLTYGDSEDLQDAHFRRFEPRASASGDRLAARNQYYPVSVSARPEAAKSITVSDLKTLLSQNPAVAITGAGISTRSGIPSLRGPAGLERHFPLHERFPGAVADLMIEKPRKLAEFLASFQAAFLQAEPNGAHRALADLEGKGRVLHLITGNGDRLHERAGSVNVHLKNPDDFKSGARGWGWFKEGKVLLAIGLGRDEHGLISYSRDSGMKIVAVSPDRPEFLHADDLYVAGRAEDVLPCLTC